MSADQHVDGRELLMLDANGEPAAYLGPELAEHLDPILLEGIARRRLVALGKQCPCGTRMQMPNRAERRAAARKRGGVTLWRVDIEHEPDCPAVDPRLGRGWRA